MNIKFLQTTMAFVAAAFLSNAAVLAQSGGNYSLTWSTIDGGGASCAAGSYALSGTIGQPDANAATGGTYRLNSGFWPGLYGMMRPMLHIAVSGPNVIISWPASANGFYLQHCTDLARSTWASNPTPAFVFGADKVVVEPAANMRLYRLTQ